jgi:hypothetical protein
LARVKLYQEAPARDANKRQAACEKLTVPWSNFGN